MVPKTKNQKRVEELSSTLPALNKAKIKWMNSTCFEHLGFRRKSGTMCMECGHEFTATGETSVCPKCKTNLKILDTKKRSNQSFSYACFIETCQEWQVVRYYELYSSLYRERKADYTHCEIVQIWINPKGERVIRARLIAAMNSNKYSWFSKLEIRKDHEKYDYLATDFKYPEMNVLPELTRNGFNGVIGKESPQLVFKALLSSPEMETIKKRGLDNYFEFFIEKRYLDIKDYWPSLKICFRNNYLIEKVNPSTFVDHIKLLQYFKLDIRSPKYVCPKNFTDEHNKLAERKARKEAKEWERQNKEYEKKKRKELLERDKKFKAEKAKFSSLLITDGKFVIEPLLSVKDFQDESNYMKHCVFDERYMGKTCLILSAKINGVKLETVEVDLNEFVVKQSRGIRNKFHHYHRKIVLLVRANMELIKSCTKSRNIKLKIKKAA